jgi:hypothetical protein
VERHALPQSLTVQEALRSRLRELTATYVRHCYLLLTLSLRQEGWAVNAKRFYGPLRRGATEGANRGAEKDRTAATVASAAATTPN